jgi:hypothetical protein
MTELEQRREVLLARIEAHRTMLDLEVRCARASVSVTNRVLGAFGLDGAVAGAMVSGLRLASGGQADSLHDLAAALPLLVAAVLRILAGRRDDEPPPADQPAS